MDCLYCGCELRCVRTFGLRDEKIRMRQCRGCGRTVYTSETMMNFAEGKELYDGLARDKMRERRMAKWEKGN